MNESAKVRELLIRFDRRMEAQERALGAVVDELREQQLAFREESRAQRAEFREETRTQREALFRILDRLSGKGPGDAPAQA